MKTLGAPAAGLALLLLATGAGAPARAAEPLALKVEAARGAVQLGEPVELHLSLVAPAGAQVELPGETVDLGPFELVRAGTQAAAPLGSGGMRHEVALTVRTFAADSSRVTLPALTALVQLAGESAPRRVQSEPLTLGLERISAPAEARGDTLDLRPLKAVIELPLGWPRWPLVLLLALLAAAVVTYLWRRRRRPAVRPQIVDRRPCDVIALEALAELRADGLARRGELMEHYVRLTDIVRPYLERRYGFPAVDQTTSEILAAMAPALAADEPGRSAELSRELERLLSAADLVKFAQHEPAPALAEGELDRAAEFVRATAPRRVPPQAPAPAGGSPPPPPPPSLPTAEPLSSGRVAGGAR